MSSSRAKVFASDTKPSAISGMKPLNIECALGHDTGISGSSYYRPTDQQLLDDYLLAVDSLTVSDESRLKSQVEQLTKREEEMKTMTYIHELEIKELRDQVKQDVEGTGGASRKIKAGNCKGRAIMTVKLIAAYGLFFHSGK